MSCVSEFGHSSPSGLMSSISFMLKDDWDRSEGRPARGQGRDKGMCERSRGNQGVVAVVKMVVVVVMRVVVMVVVVVTLYTYQAELYKCQLPDKICVTEKKS